MGKPFHINRRTVLRGAGSIAIALPWLEIMGSERANAATPAKRFVTVYTPGGSVVDDGNGKNRWRPVGTESNFTLSPILEPLESIKHKLIVMDGMRMTSAIGEQHQGGIIAWLTGTTQNGTKYARGPSIDQVLAPLVSAGKPKASIQMAVRWATGLTNGLLHPANCANYEDNAKFDPIPPRLDPQDMFASLFGAVDPDNKAERDRIERKKSILDFVDRKYDKLSQRLGGADRAKLDQHLTKLRELETSLEDGTIPASTCVPPMHVDTSDYDPTKGSQSSAESDAAIPKVGRFMMDMAVMALACDRTNVLSFQWTDTEAKHTFPWLNLNQHHHYYQHDGGFRPNELEKIYRWYSEQHAYLLTQMDSITVGDHTLLDESVVFFGSELAQPPSHAKADMPFLLAGRGGGMRSGRFLRNANLADRSHNNLLVAILNLFGDMRTTFGDPEHCSGPYSGLT